MKIIALRGASGSGKSFLAKEISKHLGGKVICIDWIKSSVLRKEIVKNNDWTTIYKLTSEGLVSQLRELLDNNESLVIIEELFINIELINKVISFSNDKNVEIKWFKINRSMEQLLEVTKSNERQERKVKNTEADLKSMICSLKETPINGEIIINNDKSKEDVILQLLNYIEK